MSILLSCKEEPVPAYITIDAIELKTTAGQGTASAAIPDAWIYVNDNLVGAFELPCRIPVLNTGKCKVSVGGGIRVNDNNYLRSSYVFYRFHNEEKELVPGEVLSLSPEVHYFDNLTFTGMSDFEGQGSILEATPLSDTIVGVTNKPEDVFEGNGSFVAELKRDSGGLEFQFVEKSEFPKGGEYVYMELNYKTNVPLSVGLMSYYNATSSYYNRLLNLKPTSEWKKVYINLTHAVSTEINALDYRVQFGAIKEPGTAPLKILIDNIKIIHF